MAGREIRRTFAVFPMGSVMKLTNFSARQIRYYEEQQLITPDRNEGNHRLFSLDDIDRLLEIRDYLDEGYSIAEVRDIYKRRKDAHRTEDAKARRLLRDEILNSGPFRQQPHKSNTFNK
ncbi:MerR family transcriptional regulator [Brochothrix campestris]|uniref:MerR family regulatory protein n=1 Tax=Brochothrix campestris FSL F6-1037 TaxID=1265861 RepID=W7CZI9_9LIST|nr:MerR family transcriptional regulator [Brochothrix campestris]EUJ42185.1 MerR family regulatory protein [Brochothrix campestris FSL F6-1037]